MTNEGKFKMQNAKIKILVSRQGGIYFKFYTVIFHFDIYILN